MKKFEVLVRQYKSNYAAAKELGIRACQVQRLIDKGAYYDEVGRIYIPSTSVIKNLELVIYEGN